MNLRRREREAKAPVALWAASGPSRPEGGTKTERAAEETACERSEAGGQVLSPQPNEENSTERVLFFSFEYEREGLEPEKARAGGQSAGGTLGSERSEPSGGRNEDREGGGGDSLRAERSRRSSPFP